MVLPRQRAACSRLDAVGILHLLLVISRIVAACNLQSMGLQAVFSGGQAIPLIYSDCQCPVAALKASPSKPGCPHRTSSDGPS